MPGTITIATDSTQPNKTVSATISDDVLHACASFVRDQNSGTPGKYAGIADLLVKNLQAGLWASLEQQYPNPSITALQAQLNSIQAQIAALLAASNPPVTVAPDPVTVTPF